MIDVYKTDNPTFGPIRIFVDEPIKMIYLAGIDVGNSLGYKRSRNAIQRHVPEQHKRKIYREEINPNHIYLVNRLAVYIVGLTIPGVFRLLDRSRLKNDKVLEYQQYIRSIALPYSTFSKNSVDNGRFVNLLR